MSNNEKTEYAIFNQFEVAMPRIAAMQMSTPGEPADVAVDYWIGEIERPVKATPAALREELRLYGAWEEFQLRDSDATNWKRIVWLAACNIREELDEQGKVTT